MGIKPPSLSSLEVADYLIKAEVLHPIALLGLRGFYGTNQRGVYDDAIFLHSPTYCTGYSANCDPSVTRHGIAVLNPGLWFYKIGIHGLNKPPELQYKALVQASPVVVTRDEGLQDSGFLGINIHRGSYHSTSSEGCQTIYPDQWDEFMKALSVQIAQYRQNTIPYLLQEVSNG